MTEANDEYDNLAKFCALNEGTVDDALPKLVAALLADADQGSAAFIAFRSDLGFDAENCGQEARAMNQDIDSYMLIRNQLLDKLRDVAPPAANPSSDDIFDPSDISSLEEIFRAVEIENLFEQIRRRLLSTLEKNESLLKTAQDIAVAYGLLTAGCNEAALQAASHGDGERASKFAEDAERLNYPREKVAKLISVLQRCKTVQDRIFVQFNTKAEDHGVAPLERKPPQSPQKPPLMP